MCGFPNNYELCIMNSAFIIVTRTSVRLYVMVGLPDVWISQQLCIMHYELCISPVSVLLYQLNKLVHSLVFRNEFLDTFLFFIKVDFASC